MRRVVVVGASGAGKSSLARELSVLLGIPHIELDALHWGPNWTEVPSAVRRSRVEAAVAAEAWTICGNYLPLRDIIWPRADTVVWLDYSMGVVMWRVVRRSVCRCVTKESLWSTNVETWGKTFFSSDSIIVWSWNTWRSIRHQYSTLFRAQEWPGIEKYRFRSPRQTENWLSQLRTVST
jgi:adenylate kinase family enzyme